MPERDPTISPPHLPQDPNRVTLGEVHSLIDAKILAFWENQKDAVMGTTAQLRKKALYKNIAIGVGGFVVGVGSTLAIKRLWGKANSNATMTKPTLVAMK